MLLHKGEVDGMICGTWGTTATHLPFIDQVIGKRAGVKTFACMTGLILPARQVFLVDTHVNADPSTEEIAEITVMAAEEMRRFGLQPKAALLSHSNFGSSNLPSALKMRDALPLVREAAPWLEVDGEMHGDAALNAAYRTELMPRTTLSGEANLLVLPDIDSANIAYNLEASRRWRHRHRAGAAGRGQAGAHPHAIGDRQAHRQHDRSDGGRRQRLPLLSSSMGTAGSRGRPRGGSKGPTASIRVCALAQ